MVGQVGNDRRIRDKPADALLEARLLPLALGRLRDTLSMPKVNGTNGTNGHHIDTAMINGVDDDDDMAQASIEGALSLISEGPFPFLLRVENKSEWNIDALALSRWLRDKEIDRIVQQRVGPIGTRITRMLTDKGKLEEKNIQDVGLLVAKELRQTLAKLETQGLIELQEVPREPQRQPNRTMFLWFFDAERAKKVLLGDLYKTMARLYEMLRRERNVLKGTFEKLQKAGVEDDAEEYLGGEEKRAYLQWRRKELWLMGEIGRLDDSVALLRDM
jgi:DNA-directed RNA polymerase III subunit RPC3